MRTRSLFTIFAMAAFVLSACGTSGADQGATTSPQTPNPTEAPTLPAVTAEAAEPQPTAFSTANWSTTAGTKDELSFAFPGNWDGSSPLTFGEGEFVKDPDLPLGVTFQIELQGNPADLLEAWGSEKVGIPGIVTFTPESVTDGPEVTIARIPCPTRIATGEGVTGQVAYVQRAEDVMEVMWFAPTDQWEDLQETFNGVLENVEIWRVYTDTTTSLTTMYVHDWLPPESIPEETGLWFKSADESTGLLVYVINEIADPVERLNAWTPDRLVSLGLSECSKTPGDRMDTLSGQWESVTGECSDGEGNKITYETSIVPDKDRLLEMIAYAPNETWEQENEGSFKYLLRMMMDFRQ